VPNNQRVQDNVTLAETLGLNRFDPDYYALELGNSVLGGSFYATRLYRDLRQNAGLVYFVSSAVEAGKTRGLYVVAYGSDPANVQKARGIVVRELTAMQTAAVARPRAETGQGHPAESLPLAESSMDRIARGLTSRAAAGLPLDEPTRAASPIPRADSRGRPGRVREVDPTTGSRPGHRGAQPRARARIRAHLLRWRPRPHAQRTAEYASRAVIGRRLAAGLLRSRVRPNCC
jgi:hypothetical protein